MAMPYFAPTLSQGIFPNRIIRSSEIRPCACCWSNKSRHLLPCHRTIEMVSVSRKHLFIFFPSSFLFRYRRCSDGTNDVDRNLNGHAPRFLLVWKVQIRPDGDPRQASQVLDMMEASAICCSRISRISLRHQNPHPLSRPPPPHRLPYSLS
jgi:hypothetical protein